MRKKVLQKVIFAVGYLLGYFILFYLFLPFINFRSMGFYIFIILFLLGIIICFNEEIRTFFLAREKRTHYQKVSFTNAGIVKEEREISDKYSSSNMIVSSSIIGCLVALGLYLIFAFAGSKILNAKAYSKQLEIETGDSLEFENTFSYQDGEVTLPLIDKNIAFKLAQARLSEYGAQYSISQDNFTIISIRKDDKDELIRVAPLEYSNLFVSLSRMNKGVVGYIKVNLVTQEAELVKVEEGLKYMPTAKFNKDLDRHIRFKFPTKMYSNKYFEIDDLGNPYWIIPTYENEIGVISGKNSKGVITVNPVNGDSKYYDLGTEPSWIDRSIDDELVEKQATNALKYKNGFFNAVLGQKKEVFQVSDGYNYFIKNNQTYYVSGITSPNENDQTSIGFISINLTTKEAKRFNIDGITEMRAREIAQYDERVKAMQLEATWPILVNIKKMPTYFLTLKNDVQVQMYCFIDVSTGLKVSIKNSLEQAYLDYLNLNIEQTEDETFETTGTVNMVRDLTTSIEFMVDSVTDNYFVVNPSVNLTARFLKNGDKVKITYKKTASYNLVINIERVE